MALEVPGALKILVHSSEIRATERTHLHQGQTAIQEIPQTGQDYLEAQGFQILIVLHPIALGRQITWPRNHYIKETQLDNNRDCLLGLQQTDFKVASQL
jgi:hypothetical protein